MKSSKRFIWEFCFIFLLTFNLERGMESITSVVGGEVFLNCCSVPLTEIISVVWIIRYESGTSCNIATRTDNNTTSTTCSNNSISIQHKATFLLCILHIKLNDSGLYTCEIGHASGTSVIVYNVTVTETFGLQTRGPAQEYSTATLNITAMTCGGAAGGFVLVLIIIAVAFGVVCRKRNFKKQRGMQLVTAVIGEKVVLSCSNHTLQVITAVFWKIENIEGSNCSFAFRTEGNMSSSKCGLRGITLFSKDIHIFPAELNHTGNYSCQYDYNRGHGCVDYNLTITDHSRKGQILLVVIILLAAGGLVLILTGYKFRVKFKQCGRRHSSTAIYDNVIPPAGRWKNEAKPEKQNPRVGIYSNNFRKDTVAVSKK